MSLNINIEEKVEDVTCFGDIRRGEFFLLGGKVFVKFEEFFITDEIITELEYERDFEHEDDINSSRYNCWLVGSECDYRYFDKKTIVERVDIDMNVRYAE